MPFKRQYETFEVRKFMQDAEGAASPVTGAAAHARGLHAMKSNDGKFDSFQIAMLDRTHKFAGESNNQFKNRGGTPKTSAFDSLLFQSSAVTQAFNSAIGQTALGVFDDPANAARNMRMTLKFKGIGEWAGSASAPGMRGANKNAAGISKTPGAQGVLIIVDKGPATTWPFVQTCYPLDVLAASSFEVREMPGNALVASG